MLRQTSGVSFPQKTREKVPIEIGVYVYSVYMSLAVRYFKHVLKIGILVFLLA